MLKFRKNTPFLLGSFASLVALALFVARPQPGLSGKVVAVQDGDTLTLLTPAKKQVKVRLHGIDAPETRQPFGNASKRSLSDLAFGREVRVESKGKDRYGRMLGHVYAGDSWVNREQVSKGMAWHYRQYSDDPLLSGAEAEARHARRGLWQEAQPVPPWKWRKTEREQ